MDILFIFGFGWISVNRGILYLQTSAWYYLLTWLGAVLWLLFFAVRDTWESAAGFLVLAASVFFTSGIATTMTFGFKVEAERWRESSLTDFILGVAPERLHRDGSRRKIGVLLSLFFLFAALIVLLGGRLGMALHLAVFGIVAFVYFLWLRKS